MNRSLSEPSAPLDLINPLLPDSSATDEELMQLAEELRHSPLAMPLSLLMTAHLPLRGLAVAARDTLGPLLSFVLSERKRQILSRLVESPDLWQAFLDKLNPGSDS